MTEPNADKFTWTDDQIEITSISLEDNEDDVVYEGEDEDE